MDWFRKRAQQRREANWKKMRAPAPGPKACLKVVQEIALAKPAPANDNKMDMADLRKAQENLRKANLINDVFLWHFPRAKEADAKKPFESADNFIAWLKNRKFVTLGRGHFSTVLGVPGKNRIIKVCHYTTNGGGWTDYVVWANKNGWGGKFAPAVYSLKTYSGKEKPFTVCVMERLEATFADIPQSNPLAIFGTLLHYGTKHKNLAAVEVMEKLQPGISKFLVDFNEEFKNDRWDMHNDNFMLRGTDEFVLTDPIANKQFSDKFPKRIKLADLRMVA